MKNGKQKKRDKCDRERETAKILDKYMQVAKRKVYVQQCSIFKTF